MCFRLFFIWTWGRDGPQPNTPSTACQAAAGPVTVRWAPESLARAAAVRTKWLSAASVGAVVGGWGLEWVGPQVVLGCRKNARQHLEGKGTSETALGTISH